MIIKEKEQAMSGNAMIRAGNNHEQDVAYYLRREFASAKEVFILHDVNIQHNGENAQIDHLIIHAKGFVVIESKSITGEVRVNAEGEWSRSYKGRWSGMASPIRQAELQSKLLRLWFAANLDDIFDKIPILGRTFGVGGFDWQVLCAVSSNAILHREEMPSLLSKKIVKAEFVAEKLKEFFVTNKILSTLSSVPLYTLKALHQLSDFVLASQSKTAPTPTSCAIHPPAIVLEEAGTVPARSPVADIIELPALACRKCGLTDLLTGASGKFGYYVKCGHCKGNTPMKSNCSMCQSDSTKVSKSKDEYRLICEACGVSAAVF